MLKSVAHSSQTLIRKEGDQCTSEREKSNEDFFFRQFFFLLLFSGWTKKNKSRRQMMKSNLSLSLSLVTISLLLSLPLFLQYPVAKKDHIGSCSLYWDRLKKKKLPNQWRMFHPKARRKNMIFWKKSCSLCRAKFWKEVANEIGENDLQIQLLFKIEPWV